MRYRLQRHDGTDCSATMVPIQRYRHPYGGEDSDQRLDDRPPNSLLITHNRMRLMG